MALEIRPVTAQDKPHWAQLWYAYLDFYDTSLPIAVYDATFQALLSDAPDAPAGLLAILDGRPAGLVHYLFHRHCWHPEGVCYLQDLFVDDTMRGRGVGRALMQAVFEAADARNVTQTYWLTQDFNATARKLYDSVGRDTPFIKYVRGA